MPPPNQARISPFTYWLLKMVSDICGMIRSRAQHLRDFCSLLRTNVHKLVHRRRLKLSLEFHRAGQNCRLGQRRWGVILPKDLLVFVAKRRHPKL